MTGKTWSSARALRALLLPAACLLSCVVAGAPRPLSLLAERLPESSGRAHVLVAIVAVGSPPQQVRVVVDTHSAVLAVTSSRCARCGSGRKFDEVASATCRSVAAVGPAFLAQKSSIARRLLRSTSAAPAGPAAPAGCSHSGLAACEPLRIAQGWGEAHGVAVTDQVCLANSRVCASAALLTVTQRSAAPFNIVDADGVLGLGMPSQLPRPYFDVIDAWVRAGALPSHRFAVWLDRASRAARLDLGGHDRAALAPGAKLFWEKTASSAAWAVPLRSVGVRGAPLGLCGVEGVLGAECRALADPSSGHLQVPSLILPSLQGALSIADDCVNYDTLPDIEFSLNGVVLSLTKEDYVERGERCHLRVVAADFAPPGGPLVVLGAPFLERFYVAFDRESESVGFALSRQPGANADPARFARVR